MDFQSRRTNEANLESQGITPAFVGADHIAEILGDTIISQQPPLTIGIYGKWNSGKTQLLHRTRNRMRKMVGINKGRKKLSVSLFSLLYRLLFFNPVLNSASQTKASSYLFVHFSILDYAGCDKMWAGVLTHISETLDKQIGKWPIRLFRIFHYKTKHLDPYLEEIDDEKIRKERWKFRTTSLVIVFVALVLLGSVIALWAIYGTPKLTASEDVSSTDIATVLLTVGVGFGIIAHSSSVLQVIPKLLFSQAQKVNKLSKQADFTKSLGFMDKVRSEIYYITAVLRYIGILLNKNFKICLIIDDIDLLRKYQIMDLFQAVSLLHLSPNSVYVQLLCMDPMIASNLIKKALTREVYSNVSGHAFLKKHIQLPFFIPPISYRHCYGDNISHYHSSSGDNRTSPEDVPLVAILSPSNPSSSMQMEPLNQNHRVAQNRMNEEPSTYCTILSEKLKEKLLYDYDLARFIDGNERALKRVVISSQVAMGMMSVNLSRKLSDAEMKNVVAWITFVDQWPYRVSWLRQIIEDNMQLHVLEQHMVRLIANHALLEDVYHVVEAKLSRPKDWTNLLDLDNDPEAFKCFLQKFPFKVEDMKKYLPYTTNLNTAIRKIIADYAASHSVKHKSVRIIEGSLPRWLQSTPLEEWTVEEVCYELDKMQLNHRNLERYKVVANEKKISGQDLSLYSKDVLQSTFKMTPGDWNVFWMTIRAVRIFQSSTVNADKCMFHSM